MAGVLAVAQAVGLLAAGTADGVVPPADLIKIAKAWARANGKAKAPWEIALAIVAEVVQAASEQRQAQSVPGAPAAVEAA